MTNGNADIATSHLVYDKFNQPSRLSSELKFQVIAHLVRLPPEREQEFYQLYLSEKKTQSMNLDVTNGLTDLYTQIDQDILVFQTKTSLHCPPGCGWCCLSPDVETTVIEMLPLAVELFRRGEVEIWLEKAKASDYQGRCIFYQPDPLIDDNGRCQVYPWRPTICRLFGFATITKKSGEVELAACVRHKTAMPEIVAQVQQAIAVGSVDALNFSDVAQQVVNIDPTLARQRLPINEAFKVAVEKVGLYLQMSQFVP